MGKRAKHILDATGGFGHDAALLTCMGWDVTCVERHPFLAAILELAVAQIRDNPDLHQAIGDRLRVVHGDASTVLSAGEWPCPPDVVYLDPMFEGRSGSAKPRKRAQLLQRLLGTDQDAPDLLVTARAVCGRVVVKRPDDGPPLAPSPDVVFKGRLVRYDVYLQQA
jgi:16S rRNA (guanine1516-N2)-methyltransferase